MLTFIIALKSKQVAYSWERVKCLLQSTLRSVCAQTSKRFRVIVVCHEKPDIQFSHPNLTYLSVSFPIPQDFEQRRSDKRRKHLTGLLYASQFNPTHTMYVDADDYVSRYLAEFVANNSTSPGWFFKAGYVYLNGSRLIYVNRKNFHHWCGTSNAIRYDLWDIPKSTYDDSINYDSLYVGHNIVDRYLLEKKGLCISPLPFRGAIYRVGHGENIRDFQRILFPNDLMLRTKKIFFNYRPITRRLRQNYCFY